MILNRAITVERSVIQKMVTSDTFNKSFTSAQFNPEQDEVMRAEFALNGDDSHWFNTFFLQACSDCVEHLKPLNKYNRVKLEYLSSNTVIKYNMRYEETMTDTPLYLGEKIKKYIASRITLLWYLSKNLTQLSEPYVAINAACAKELNVLASSIWNNSNTSPFYQS